MEKPTNDYHEEFSLSELKLREYCKVLKYNYRSYQNNRIAIIETGSDSWKLTTKQRFKNGELVDSIEIKHYNRGGNKSGKMQYHFQCYARDLDYVFTNIISTHKAQGCMVDNLVTLKDVFEGLKILKRA